MSIINLNQELAIFKVDGIDAAVYLQGQLTNDIHDLDNKKFQFSAHLNNKGRILATFIITLLNENNYLLITSKSVAAKILPRLKMFILRSKVTFSESDIKIFLADKELSNCHNLELAPNKFLSLTIDTSAADILDKTVEEPNTWHRLLVDLGIPMIYADSSEKIIPQQINYDLIGGINFKKGCYTGQEIVARTHYLGKVKRRMQRFTTKTLPHIGQIVVSPQLNNQEIGFIVDYYQDNDQYRGLVSLQTDCANNAFLDAENTFALNCEKLIQDS